MSDSNGKQVRCGADDSPETIARIACAEWWQRTDGGRKPSSYLKFSIAGHSDGLVMAHFTKNPDTGGFRVSLMRQFHQQDVATPENPYA